MASITIGPSAESISLPNAHPQDEEFSDSLDTNQSAMMAETASRQLSPSRTMPKSPPRNGVPPKRLSMTAKRTAPATTSAPSRSNPPLASRGVSGTGLSKPPTRPLVSSAVRRPATSVTAATAASTGHRKRPSIASNEINSTKRGDLSGAEENIKPTGGKLEARRNAHDKGDIKNATQISNADKIYSATKAEHGVSPGRMGNISPTKVLRSTTNNSRPSNLHSTPRGTRPTASSTGGLAKAETTKKRLSTIPASPAPKNPDSSIVDSSIAPAISKATRPALHNRKSTISVTNEQRLREIDLVHQMLRVAAQDGDDDGRKVDESLASLRIRLEEAHRNERIEPPERENSKGSKSEFKVVAPDGEISDLQRRLQQPISGMENDTEVSSQDDALTDASEPLQEEIQRIREMQALEITELSKKHQINLAAAQAKIGEAETRYQEAMGRLESAANAYSSMSQKSDLALAAERESGAAARTMSEGLELEISRLRTVQSEQRKRLADAQQRLDEQASLLEKKEDTILEKDREIVELQSEMQEFRTQQDCQLEEVEKDSLDRLQQMEDELSVVHHDLSQSKSLHHSVIASHTKELASKDEELKVLAQVIEEFQTQMQGIHEQNEREVNETKLDLIEKHEKELDKVVSDLHREHTIDGADVEFSTRQQLQALQAEHEDALESVRVNHASEVKRLNESLWDSNVKNETMEQEIFNGKAIIEKLDLELASLKQEKVELGADFKHASDEVVGLRKTLETLGHDTEDKDKQYATALKKLEDELAKTTKALEERAAERDTSLKRHVEELDSLHSLHDVNVQTLESESRAALLEMQTSHDKLVAQLSQTEREYGEKLGALKSEHTETLGKRAKDLEHLITTHATETRDKLDQVERTHQDEIKALIQSTDQKYESLCREMNTATEQLEQHQDSRDIQAGRCEELVKVVESLKSELATSQDELSHANNEIARLTTEIEETRKTLQDTTETDHLRYEMFELTRQHAAEIARMQDTLDVENDKRAKERKQGAEVRDRLVNETEKLANDLSATKLEVDKYRMELHAAKTESQVEVKKNDANRQARESAQASHQKIVDDLKEAQALIEKLNSELSRQRDQEESSNFKHQKTADDLEEARTAIEKLESEMSQQRDEQESSNFNHQKTADDLKEAQAAIEKLKSEMSQQRDEEESFNFNHQKTADDLKEAQAAIEKLRSEMSQQRDEEESSNLNQELEALQIAADAEREQNTKLREEIREAIMAAERQATKLREAQAALKVTSAELTELRTIRPNGSQFSASPAPKSGLRSSRWAIPEDSVEKVDIIREEDDADEDLGATISGNMASMQEQLRQMEETNHEMMEDELRLVDRLSLVCPPTSPISEYDPNAPGTRVFNEAYEDVL